MVVQMVKNLPAMQETQVQFLVQEGNGYPLQYFYLESSMNRGAQWTIVHRVSKEPEMTEKLNTSVFCFHIKGYIWIKFEKRLIEEK